MRQGFLNLVWTAAIFVNLFRYEQGPVDAGVCHCIAPVPSCFFWLFEMALAAMLARLLPFTRTLLNWVWPFCMSVCLCSYSIRRSWRSWGHKPSRCAPGWDVSECPLLGRPFICLTSWAVSEGLSAPIQTRIRVLTCGVWHSTVTFSTSTEFSHNKYILNGIW